VARRLLLADALLLDPEASSGEPASLLIEDGRIVARLRPGSPGPEDARRIDLGGAPLGPGLLDLHWHGDLVGRPARDAAAALAAGSASMLRHGVTGFLPTTVAWEVDELGARVAALTDALARGGWPGAEPLGIHLEGPWIRADAAGAQPVGGIRPFDAREGRDLLERSAGAVRMVTLAPEVVGSDALIAELGRRGVLSALGHTLATSDEVTRAAEEGARHATHLFNAMGSHGHREPAGERVMTEGVAAAILAEERLSCDLIADGAHVHPDWLAHAVRVKGEKVVLITDRIDLPPTEVATWADGMRLASDGVAWRLPDGRLAGSHLALHDAVRNCVRWRVMTQLDALRACTFEPARLLGIEAERGTLRPGARADLVRWGADGEPATVWVEGRVKFGDERAARDS
jgi:N-acetylglucosamine-6-phosphate deacetylase